MRKVWSFLTEYSLLLVGGAVIALIWANTDPYGYHHFVETPLWDHAPIGHLHFDDDGHAHRTLTLHYLINDVGMAFFFALAGKEVWEAVALQSGSLRGRRAFTPLIATAGGVIGPMAVYLGGAMLVGDFLALANGWAIPVATDIAFSYLVGRIVFGSGHPAVRFLLLLAIADDALGLIILALFYPSAPLEPMWLLLSVAAAGGVYVAMNQIPRLMDDGDPARPVSTFVERGLGFWPFLIAGALSWYGFQEAGIHPSLGLLPVVAAIPNADLSFGRFSAGSEHGHDMLNDIEHGLKSPVEVVLFFFALANAGVEFSAIGAATWLVLAGLIIGKPAGILALGWLAARPMGLGLPEGMKVSDLFVVGCVAAIGFTVSLFISAVAFEPGPIQDAAKMGALFSFFAAGVALMAGRMTKVERQGV